MARRTTQPTTELGRVLEKERANLNLTMENMAKHLGVSKPTYISWLRGGVPEPQNIRTIMDKLGLSLEEIMRLVFDVMSTYDELAPWVLRPMDRPVVVPRLRAA